MFYGYGLLTSHTPTLKATAMRGGSNSPFLASLFAVYKSESNANDSLGNYNGTAQGGLTYASGKSGNAFVFNGTNAYVSLPNDMVNFSGDFSISFWGYLTSTSNFAPIIDAFKKHPSFNTYYGWDISMLYSSKTIIFETYPGSGVTTYTLTSPSNTGYFNTWCHFVITRKKDTSTKMYINGSLVAADTNTINPVYLSPNKFDIGRNVNGASIAYSPNGTMVDELYLWTKELTSTEVTTLYNSGTGKFYPTF
jgi:hypothetical protein